MRKQGIADIVMNVFKDIDFSSYAEHEQLSSMVELVAVSTEHYIIKRAESGSIMKPVADCRVQCSVAFEVIAASSWER